MKKTIMLSLVVTSLVMGANTVTNLEINQQNEITSSSTIDNATVDQGKTEVLGASIVSDVTIGVTVSGSESKNIIDASSIKMSQTDGSTTTVSQGFLKVDNSKASQLLLDTRNSILNIDITNTKIEQGGLTVEGNSEAKDIETSIPTELDATNIISNTSAESSSVDINGKEIKQAVTVVSGGAVVKKFLLNNKNKIDESTVNNSEVYQSNLKIDGSGTDVTTLTITLKEANANEGNYILNSEISSDSVIKQNDITIQNTSVVSTLISKTNNTIDSFKADKSLISQNEMFIDNSAVTGFTTTQTNEIIGTAVNADGTYNSWSNTSSRPENTTISQGSTTIN